MFSFNSSSLSNICTSNFFFSNCVFNIFLLISLFAFKSSTINCTSSIFEFPNILYCDIFKVIDSCLLYCLCSLLFLKLFESFLFLSGVLILLVSISTADVLSMFCLFSFCILSFSFEFLLSVHYNKNMYVQ